MAACLGCAAPTPPLRCSGCRAARFCGSRCQREAWPQHRPFCLPAASAAPLEAAALASAARAALAAAASSAPLHGEAGEVQEATLQADAAVQAWVLERLGIWDGDVLLGHRPLSENDLVDRLRQERPGLARFLCGRNSFHASYRPVLRALTQDGRWPTILSVRAQGHITELPTLELCASLAMRVLCVARRLRDEGQQRLVFLGVGSGDALVEASVALHVGAVVGVSVDLGNHPVLVRWGDFEIAFIASDTPSDAERRRNRIIEAPKEMRVLPLDRRDAIRRFAAEAPLYVFSCWMPMQARWRADAEEDAGERLAEVCFLMPPSELIRQGAAEMVSSARSTSELFPRTLSRWDFLGRGLPEAGDDEAGLYHTQLYVLPAPGAAAPFLARPLRHAFGSYAARIAADRALKGVNLCRGVGLFHVHGPEDFARDIPHQHLATLAEAIGEHALAMGAASAQEYLQDVLSFLTGSARRQVATMCRAR